MSPSLQHLIGLKWLRHILLFLLTCYRTLLHGLGEVEEDRSELDTLSYTLDELKRFDEFVLCSDI